MRHEGASSSLGLGTLSEWGLVLFGCLLWPRAQRAMLVCGMGTTALCLYRVSGSELNQAKTSWGGLDLSGKKLRQPNCIHEVLCARQK